MGRSALKCCPLGTGCDCCIQELTAAGLHLRDPLQRQSGNQSASQEAAPMGLSGLQTESKQTKTQGGHEAGKGDIWESSVEWGSWGWIRSVYTVYMNDIVKENKKIF